MKIIKHIDIFTIYCPCRLYSVASPPSTSTPTLNKDKPIFPPYSLIFSIFQIHCYSTIFFFVDFIFYSNLKKIVLYFFNQTGPSSLFFGPKRAGIVLYLKITVLYFLAQNRIAFSILSFSIKKKPVPIFTKFVCPFVCPPNLNIRLLDFLDFLHQVSP